MTQSEPKVFVVDDDPAVLNGLRLLMKSVGMSVETYLNAQDFLNSYDSAQPGCLVLDVRMPGMSGLELQETLEKRDVDLPVIIVTGFGDVPVAVQALKKGAVDFIEKPFSDQVLLDQIQNAIAEDALTRQKRAKREAAASRLVLLTPREREVMNAVIAGKLNKVIARELGISQKTVEFHRAHVMEKMGVNSVAELVRFVIDAGDA